MGKRLSDLTVEEALNILRKGCAVLYFKKFESGRIESYASWEDSVWYYLAVGGFTLHFRGRQFSVTKDTIASYKEIYLCGKDEVDSTFHELNNYCK